MLNTSMGAWLAVLPLLLGVTFSSAATGEPSPSSFAAEVSAVLQRNCVSCHGEDEQSGGLRLDSYPSVMRGGDRGPVVVARDPDQSLLLQKVTRRDRPFMPPKKTLPARDIALLRTWIQSGAPR
jgi:mono/diheme cytochrome c family protein